MYDCIIVGHGPAGLTAAIYLARANKKVLAIGKDLGVLGSGIKLENYYGVPQADGLSLAKSAYDQASSLGVFLVGEEVLNIESSDDVFVVTTNQNNYQAKTVVLATGANRTKLNIKGFNNYNNKGIHYCVTCDGFFYRKKRVGIIGADNYMKLELDDLKNITDDIIVFTNGIHINDDLNVKIVTDKIVEFIGSNERLSAIKTTDNTYDLDGVFLAIGSPGAVDFARKIGIIIENNLIAVDDNLETNIKGIFAAGDIIGGKMQVVKASYDGMKVASSILHYLKTNN